MILCKQCLLAKEKDEMDGNICKDCKEGKTLKQNISNNTNTNDSGWTFPLIFVGILILVGYLAFAPESKEDIEKKEKEKQIQEEKKKEKECFNKNKAYFFTQGYVRSKLKAPSSAIFAEKPFNVYEVQEEDCRHIIKASFEAKNTFGVMLKQKFRAVVVFDKDKNTWIEPLANLRKQDN